VSADDLAKLSEHQDDTVRLTAVVALRRQQHAGVANFLNDANQRVILEAARAIHDTPIDFAMVALSELIARPLENRALALRVLNANFRIGSEQAAARVAKFATRAEADESLRIEALQMLADWTEPGPLDRLLGDYRPLEKRDPGIAAAALQPQIDLLMSASEKVRMKAIEVAANLGIAKIAPELARQVSQTNRTADARGKALIGLAALSPETAVRLAEALPDAEMRGPMGAAALRVLAEHAAAASIDRFIAATNSTDVKVRQLAWDILADIKDPRADQAIAAAVKQYIEGKLNPRVQLNVIEAAPGRLPADLKTRLDQHRQQLAESDPLGMWLDSLSGGDPDRGGELFFGKTELSCVRCHKVGRAGGAVGPNLSTIGKDRDRRYLLESICLPDAKIAEGFETTVLIDIDGRVHGGILKTETDQFVELVLADGSSKRIAQDDIEARRQGKSSMPADLVKQMTARELRDLVAYLAGLRSNSRGANEVE
jgi:quinoprotein glucose dehydrogenase